MAKAHDYDVIIIGAGAAGMMCASVASERGRKVCLIDHAPRIGEKIRISGGGRCNFTNIHCGPNNFISDNPHFAKSALSRYSPQDFIDLIERYKISWHEKTKGQLFCDESAQQIIDMLIHECETNGVEFRLGTKVLGASKMEDGFVVTTPTQTLSSEALVIACGGPSIPKIGASGFGYQLATQFGLGLVDPAPALVPLTFTDQLKDPIAALSGVSVQTRITHVKSQTYFEDAMLFTHRGLSGPAILQISSYWRAGDDLCINMAPKDTEQSFVEKLRQAKIKTPKLSPEKWLGQHLPTRLSAHLTAGLKHKTEGGAPYRRLADMPDHDLQNLALQVTSWHIRPAGTEGYRKAEVTRGGVDTKELSSKTLEARRVKGLYFIGEVVDVTGHLGGHNFQWAWASAQACGKHC